MATQPVIEFEHASAEASPPVVLAVIPGQPTETSFVFARRQIAALREHGIDVRTFHLAERTSPAGIFREWKRLRQEISNIQPDVVHAHYGTMTAFLCAISKSAGTRLVITYRGSDLNGCPGIGWIRNTLGPALSQLAALRAAQVICVSERLRARLWSARNRATVIASGVDLKAFQPMARGEARQKLGWLFDEPVVLFNVGNEPLLKGLDLARETIKAARRRAGHIRLHILDGQVSPDSMPLYINAADCVLLCSVKEGSPNIVKEALACNVPVVSVDVGDVREQSEGVSPGAVISARAPEQLGRALAEILRVRVRSNGRSKVAHLSHEIVCEKLIAVYNQAAQYSSRSKMQKVLQL